MKTILQKITVCLALILICAGKMAGQGAEENQFTLYGYSWTVPGIPQYGNSSIQMGSCTPMTLPNSNTSFSYYCNGVPLSITLSTDCGSSQTNTFSSNGNFYVPCSYQLYVGYTLNYYTDGPSIINSFLFVDQNGTIIPGIGCPGASIRIFLSNQYVNPNFSTIITI